MKKKYLALSVFFMFNICAENLPEYAFSLEVERVEIVVDDAPEQVDLDQLKIKASSFYRNYSELNKLLKRLTKKCSLLLDVIGRTVELYSGIDQLSILQQKIASIKSQITAQRFFKGQIDQLIKEINEKIECNENFDVLGQRLFELLAEAEVAHPTVADEIE